MKTEAMCEPKKGTSIYCSFADESWKKELIQAYSFRFTETPDFKQGDNHITTAVNSEHREGLITLACSLRIPIPQG